MFYPAFNVPFTHFNSFHFLSFFPFHSIPTTFRSILCRSISFPCHFFVSPFHVIPCHAFSFRSRPFEFMCSIHVSLIFISIYSLSILYLFFPCICPSISFLCVLICFPLLWFIFISGMYDRMIFMCIMFCLCFVCVIYKVNVLTIFDFSCHCRVTPWVIDFRGW